VDIESRHDMKHEIQHFPRLTIERLPSGLIRFEDDSCLDGPQMVDAHPSQVQVAASMLGFEMPDKSRRALARLARTVASITKQTHDLKGFLGDALDAGVHVGLELNCAENIATRLDELVQDLEAIQAPDLEPTPGAPSNQGGQLTLPV
jgi:hypothetical protein